MRMEEAIREFLNKKTLKVGDTVMKKKDWRGSCATIEPLYILEIKAKQARFRDEGWVLLSELQRIVWLCDDCIGWMNLNVGKYTRGKCCWCEKEKDFPAGSWIAEGDLSLNLPTGRDKLGLLWIRSGRACNYADCDSTCPTCGKNTIYRSMRTKPGEKIVYSCSRCGPLMVPSEKDMRDRQWDGPIINDTKQLKKWLDFHKSIASIGSTLVIDGEDNRLILVDDSIRVLDVNENRVIGRKYNISNGSTLDVRIKLSMPMLFQMLAQSFCKLPAITVLEKK